MQDTLAKKIFAVGSAAAMVASLVAPLAAHAAAHGVGTNVKSSDGTIWYITSSGTRRAYTSAGAFTSYGFNSFATVVDANSDDLNLPVDSAGFIPPQDGKIFCATATKGSDVKGECALVTGGMKAAFTSASVFTGNGFSFSRAQYGDSSFLSKTSNIDNTTAAHRTGVLVNNGGTVQLVGSNGLLGIPDLTTFNSWGYSFSDVVPANTADKALTQTGVMVARQAGQLNPTWTTGSNPGNPNQPPVVNGSVSAMLSSDTPAANTLVSSSVTTRGSQTGADIAHFAFSGTGTVTQVVIKRTGVSSDTSINNVYLYMGNNRITDAGTFSNGQVTFANSNGLFTVNGSAVIGVRVDVASSVSGQTVGAQLASYTVANGTPMSTSITGNLFNIAAVSDVASVQLSVNSNMNSVITGSGASAGTAGSINAGTMNANLWGTTVSVSQRAVKLQYIQFKQIGSVAADAIQNLKLMVDGSQAGSTASVMNSGANTNVVIFDLSGSPVNLNTGSHTIELHGDVVKGSSYNYEFTIQSSTDALFLDSSYGVNVPLTGSSGATIVQLNPGLTSVNSGTVSIQTDPTYTQNQFVKNASNVTLGQWTMKAYGEDVKVQTLKVTLTYKNAAGAVASAGATEGFNNLSLYVNGGSVGSSQSALYSTSTADSTGVISYTYGTTNLFTIPAGQTVTVTVKGDNTLVSNTGVATVRADLVTTTTSSFQGVTSFTLGPTAGSTYTGTAQTVSASSATTGKNTAYNNQTIAPNLTKQKIGSFVIQASQADGVRVNTLTVTFVAGANNSITPSTGIANLYLVTPDFPSGTTPMTGASSTQFSVNFTVAMNQTATVDVYADISNTSGTLQPSLTGTGIGTTSSQTVYLTTDGGVSTVSAASAGNSVTGQLITVGVGTISSLTLKASSPIDSFVIAGGQNQPAGTFNFVAASGGLTITQLDFMATSTVNEVPVTGITAAGVLGNVVGATTTISGLNIVVPTTYSGVDVPVTMNLGNVGVGGKTGNQVFTVNLTHVKYIAGGTTHDNYYNTATNSFNLVGSAPTVSIAAPSALLTAGTQTVAKVTITANAAGDIIVRNLPLTFSASGGASTTIINGAGVTIVDDATGQSVTASSTAVVVSSGGSGSTVVTLSTDNTIGAGTSKTYNIQVPVGGTFAASPGATISVTMGAATGFTFKDVNSNADNIAVKQTNNVNGASLTATYIPNYPTNSVSIHN